MELENQPIKGSITTVHFLKNFSCLICKEIGNLPYYLKCDNIFCENCIINLNMKQSNGDVICQFCFETTKKEELLPELEMRLLLRDLKSSDDELFFKKYKNILNFNNGEYSFRNIISFLIKFFSIENKCIIKKKHNEKKKKCDKRNYLNIKNDTFYINNNNYNLRSKPIFKAL